MFTIFKRPQLSVATMNDFEARTSKNQRQSLTEVHNGMNLSFISICIRPNNY